VHEGPRLTAVKPECCGGPSLCSGAYMSPAVLSCTLLCCRSLVGAGLDALLVPCILVCGLMLALVLLPHWVEPARGQLYRSRFLAAARSTLAVCTGPLRLLSCLFALPWLCRWCGGSPCAPHCAAGTKIKQNWVHSAAGLDVGFHPRVETTTNLQSPIPKNMCVRDAESHDCANLPLCGFFCRFL
jgi:hypothetical protein